MSKLLILIIISMTFAADLGYNDSEVYNCKKMANYTVAERRQILQLYPIDKWVFTLISPLVFIYSLVIMALFIMDTRLFGMPGDILFIITLSEFLKSIHLFSSGVYAIVKDYSPNPYGAFCQTNGIVSTITFAMNTLYTLAFAAYPLVLFYNSLESTSKMMRVTNIVLTIFISVGLAVVASNDNNISLGLNGLCILSPDTKESEIVIDSGMLITLLCFVFMSIMFIIAFKRVVPKNSPMRSLRGRYLRYYQRFMVFTIIMRTLQIIFGGINEINCYFYQNPYLNITITLQNITDIVIALGQCIIISQDPLLNNKFQKLVDRIYGRQAKTESIDDLKLDLGLGNNNNKSGIEMDILQQLHIQMKKAQIYSILAAIQYLRFKNNENICKYVPEEGEQVQTSSLSFSETDVSKLSWCKQICFSKEDTEEVQQVTFTNDVIKQTVKHNPDMQAFDTKCTLYAPKIFHHFVQMDNIDLEDSFDLIKNNKKIEEFEGPDGGKSGEFFFFSHDNRFIIKTMRWSEVVSLRKRLIMYANYLANFQQSLISKIYGVYTIQRADSDSKTHILIMKNIALGIDRKFIRRTFDMKGSEYDREVLAKSTRDPSKLTLKDTDFIKTEEKIFADPELTKNIHHQLKRDALLFKQLRLIDYSLLLMKIDWSASGIDVQKLINPNSLNVFESSKEKGVYYHMGIIDYLQEWNVNKNAERAAKKLITLNVDLDTSAQDPDVYADRFQQKLVDRILPLE